VTWAQFYLCMAAVAMVFFCEYVEGTRLRGWQYVQQQTEALGLKPWPAWALLPLLGLFWPVLAVLFALPALRRAIVRFCDRRGK